MKETVEVDIDSIVVRRRVRRTLGDLKSLMDSMRRHGLMNPIVITTEGELIAGRRRLESARRLGWKKVPAHILDGADEADQLEIEIEENTQRKSLSSDELAEGYLRLDRLRNPSFLRRILQAIARFFRRLFGRNR